MNAGPRIAIDAMGGDTGPAAIIAGVARELAVLLQLLANDFLVAEEGKVERGILAVHTSNSGDDCRRAGVTPHCIDRDPRACVHVRPPRASSSRQASVETISRPL